MRAFFCGLASLAALSVQAAELHVGAGKEHLIGEPVLHLQRLVLEDGATLRMAPGLGRLQLQAEQAWIGKGVRILARGEDAAAGAPGTAAVAVTGCVDGREGGAGGAGMSGGLICSCCLVCSPSARCCWTAVVVAGAAAAMVVPAVTAVPTTAAPAATVVPEVQVVTVVRVVAAVSWCCATGA